MIDHIQPFWVVWSPRGRPPLRRHGGPYGLECATTEAERLSVRFPGRHFYVLKCEGFVMEGPEIPTARQVARAEEERQWRKEHRHGAPRSTEGV